MSQDDTTITEEPKDAAVETDAQVTETAPEAAAESFSDETVAGTSEKSDAGTGAGRLGGLGARLRDLLPIIKEFGAARLAAVLVFLGISAFAFHMVQQELVYEEPAPEPEFVAGDDGFAEDLRAEELVTLGNGALESNDIDSAARFYEEARVRAELKSPDDVNLAVDVFNGLARVADHRGQPRVAELYREYVRGKQAELGDSLPLFSNAERDFRAGEWREARKGYARFLLTSAALGPAGDRYIEMARRRLAAIWEREYEARAGQPVSVLDLAEPGSYFDDAR